MKIRKYTSALAAATALALVLNPTIAQAAEDAPPPSVELNVAEDADLVENPTLNLDADDDASEENAEEQGPDSIVDDEESKETETGTYPENIEDEDVDDEDSDWLGGLGTPITLLPAPIEIEPVDPVLPIFEFTIEELSIFDVPDEVIEANQGLMTCLESNPAFDDLDSDLVIVALWHTFTGESLSTEEEAAFAEFKADALTLTSLECSGLGGDISLIGEYFTNLKSLNIGGSFAGISLLANLTGLESLTISSPIADLGTADGTVNNIWASLVNLKTLDLSGSSAITVWNLSPLTVIDGLTIYLSGDRTFEVVAGQIVAVPGFEFAVENNKGLMQCLSNTSAFTGIDIPTVEAAIWNMFNGVSAENLPAEQIAAFTQFATVAEDLTSLNCTGLGNDLTLLGMFFPNLTSLNITGTFAGVGPLAALTQLTSLTISSPEFASLEGGNDIWNYLTNLETLDLSGSESITVWNLSPLTVRESLTILLSGGRTFQVVDGLIVAPGFDDAVAVNKGLIQCLAASSEFSEINTAQVEAALWNLFNGIALENLPAAQIQALTQFIYVARGMTDLTCTDLGGDLSMLGRFFTGLTSLNIAGSFTGIAPLAGLTGLESLTISSPIADLGTADGTVNNIWASLVNLKTLDLSGSSAITVWNLSPLTVIDGLTIYLSGDRTFEVVAGQIVAVPGFEFAVENNKGLMQCLSNTSAFTGIDFPTVEAAIWNMFNGVSAENLPAEQIAAFTQFATVAEGLTSLNCTGLGNDLTLLGMFFPNLTSLIIAGTFQGIAPLANLTSLQSLTISAPLETLGNGNNIWGSLDALTSLVITSPTLYLIEGLASAESLVYLTISAPITSLYGEAGVNNVWGYLQNLEVLNLYSATNITAVGQLQPLVVIDGLYIITSFGTFQVIDGVIVSTDDEDDDDDEDIVVIDPFLAHLLAGGHPNALVTDHFGTWDGVSDLVATVDVPLDYFDDLAIDGVTIAPANYGLASGSTVITLSANFIRGLAENRTHTITAHFQHDAVAHLFNGGRFPVQINLHVPARTQQTPEGPRHPATGVEALPLLLASLIASAGLVLVLNRRNSKALAR